MKNTELFLALRTFSTDEMQAFGNYLSSPYFNKSRKLVLLYDEIKKYHPLFTDISLNKKELYGRIYRLQKYNDSTMRNLFSDLHRLALDFLTYEAFGKKGKDKQAYLLEELNGRNLTDEFSKSVKALERSGPDGEDWNYFLNMHFLETAKFNYSSLNDKIIRGNNLNKELKYLNDSSRHLVYFYVTELIANYLNLLVYSREFNIDLRSQPLHMIMDGTDIKKIKEIFAAEGKNSNILEIYTALVETFSDVDNTEKYFIYRKLVEENSEQLSMDEISFHFMNFMSYCAVKIRLSGLEFDFSMELFDIYKIALANGYYKNSKTNRLAHELYRNILRHGLRMKDYEWTRSFIDEYSRKVHPDDIFNMYNYGMAYLSYNMGYYDDGLKYLQEVEQDYFIYKFDIKNLTLMIYYELNYTEECLYLCKTYREFLRKDRLLLAARRKRYANFIKFVEKLILYKAGAYRYELGYIRHGLAKNDAVAFKNWIAEKIDLLERRIDRAV